MLASLPALAVEPVAIFSDVYNGYKRTRLPDGSYKTETYAFANGGMQTRAIDDRSLTAMTFTDVARATVDPLKKMGYVMATKPEETDLMIILYWGVTEGSSGNDASNSMQAAAAAIALDNATRQLLDSSTGLAGGLNSNAASEAANTEREAALWQLAIANMERDRIDAKNARILGYREALQRANFAPHFATSQDVFYEVGDNRYYVVLQAYDFKVALKQKKLKPLWTTRISISEHGKRFDDSIARMVASAAPYLGKGDGTLHRREKLRGKVEIGPVEVIETEPGKS